VATTAKGPQALSLFQRNVIKCEAILSGREG
jgi:hypothetical protein